MRWHGILLALWVSCIACLLQVSLGQTTACTESSDCPEGKCCDGGNCSAYDEGSREGGRVATYACECLTGSIGDDNVCGCETNSDCANDKCCISGQCSVYDIGSRKGGLAAASACECFVGEIGDDNMCGCDTASDCWYTNKCCISGQCSVRDEGSREGGLSAGSACECMSGIIGDDNVCGCETDSDCFGDKCCADGLCSTYDKGSRDFGEAIMDACECSSGVDAGDATCGEGEALTNACFVSGSDDYRCIPGRGKLINLSDCGLTDEDIDDLRACVEEGSSSFGIENVKKINLKRNDFTTLPSDLFSGLLKLRKLNVKANCDLGCVPAPDGASTKELEIRTSRCNKNAIDSVC